MLSATSLTAAAFGTTLPFSVTRDGRAVTPVLTIRRDRRWLTEREVVSVAALATRQITSVGPGEVVINVAAEGLLDSVTVRITPPQPMVTALTGPASRTHLGAGDTLSIRGYAMHQVAATQIFAASLGLTVAATSDSATLRLVTTLDPAATCTGRPAPYRLTPVGVTLEVPAATSFTRARIAERSLDVGSAAYLSGTEAACIRLAPKGANARYLLAWADDRVITMSESQFPVPAPPDVTVQVSDKSGPPLLLAAMSASAPALTRPGRSTSFAQLFRGRVAQRTAPPSMQQGAVDPPFVACGSTPSAAAWAVYCRATPWTVGATFNYQPLGGGKPAGVARIIAVTPTAVAAVFQPDEGFLSPQALPQIQATLDFLHTSYLATLQQDFLVSHSVVTSPGSNQVVIMFEAGIASNTIRSPSDALVPQGGFAMVSMLLNASNCYAIPANCSGPGIDVIMVHEVAHTFQFLRNREARNGQQPFGFAWSTEGGASLHELLAPMAFHNIPWDANTQFEVLAQNDPRRAIGNYANGALSSFTLGYRTSASFLRHLMQRLVKERGVSLNVARHEVQIGGLEGWYGIGFNGANYGTGLVPRMRSHFGNGWDPVQAMLEWTMAQAADDLTANPLFQDLTARINAREVAGRYVHNGFAPTAALVSGAGASSQVTVPSGNTGVFQLNDTDAGGSYEARSTISGVPVTAPVRWLLLRVQ